MVYTDFDSCLGTPFAVLSASYYDDVSDIEFAMFLCESELETDDDILTTVGRFLLNESTCDLYYYEDPYTPLKADDLQKLSFFIKEHPENINTSNRINRSLDDCYERYNEVV